MEKVVVKDIDFKSTEHVLTEIRNMNVKGGSPFGRSAAWAYKLSCEKEKFDSYSQLKKRFNELKKELNELKPTMATINNSSEIIHKIVDDNKKKNIDEICKLVVETSDRIINYSFDAVEKVGLYGANFIKNGDVIMMHSYSSTLMQIFIEAKKKKKQFKVICTESRPLRESRNAVNILQDLEVDTVFISDASAYEFMKKADYIIMGADSMDTNGSVANKMGTAQIAKLASFCKIPVYIASELYKLDIRTQKGYQINLERRDPFELISKDDFKTDKFLTVINQFFDVTPANDITAIITEFGFLHPAQLSYYYSQLINKILK